MIIRFGGKKINGKEYSFLMVRPDGHHRPMIRHWSKIIPSKIQFADTYKEFVSAAKTIEDYDKFERVG